MRLFKALLPLLALGAIAAPARADVKLHPLFTDHMVLQRDTQVTIWGKADPGEQLSVKVDQRTANGAMGFGLGGFTADKDGNWSIPLPKLEAGTGYTLTVSGKNTVTLKDVAVGEVWICSGQSNMQWEMWRLTKDDQGKRVSAGATNPNIRLYTVPRIPAPEPRYDYPVQEIKRDGTHTATFGRWEQCTPESVLEFSSVAYYFGRDLQKALGVPVGLIATNWGGTVCEAWTSKEALEANPALKHLAAQHTAAVKGSDPVKAKANYEAALVKWKAEVEAAKKAGKKPPPQPRPARAGGVHQNTPTALYNSMIHPIERFAVRGAIWYQGESNTPRAAEYRTLFPAMIQDWRKRWGTDLPFLAVQLAPFGNGKGNSGGVTYAELRDAQLHATKVLPKVGLAVITDAGDETDIHPQQKEPVGARLALAAEAIAYGKKVEYRGPEYRSQKVEGDKVVLSFDHAGGGLVAKGGELAGFTVAGPDNKFVPATAQIKGDTVVVSSPDVPKPVAVRYGWVNFAKPTLNLFNKAGLPASPFRTDDLPLTTAPKK